MNNGIIYIILLILGIGIGVIGTDYFTTPETITETVTETVVDTQYVQQPADTIIQRDVVEVMRRDTMYVTRQETLYVERGQEYAELDTTFTEGHLRARFYLPPTPLWDVTWQPTPQSIPTITTTQTTTVTPQPQWYQRKEVWGIAGLIVGSLLSR